MAASSLPLPSTATFAPSTSSIEGLSRSKSSLVSPAVIWLVLASAAQAGSPFVTDDPRPPSGVRMGNQCAVHLERTPGRTSTEMNAPLLDLNYGLPNVLAFRPKQYSL
jgi:hypothetical protein